MSHAPLVDVIQCREIAERFDTWEKEVSAALHGGKGRQAGDCFADRTLGNFKFERTVLLSDDRIVFIAKLVKVAIISPHVLKELELADEACAYDKSGDATLNPILRRVVRQE